MQVYVKFYLGMPISLKWSHCSYCSFIVEKVVVDLKRKLAQAFTKFEYFLSSLLPKEYVVELRSTDWLKLPHIFCFCFHPPFVYCYSCHLCYQKSYSQVKEVGWCKIQYIWTFLFSLFLAICLLLLHLHCHRCYD